MNSKMNLILEGLQEERLNEAQWKTMHGNHILVDDNGDILTGGPKSMRKKGVSKKDIKDAVKDANARSAAENVKKPGKDDYEEMINKKYGSDSKYKNSAYYVRKGAGSANGEISYASRTSHELEVTLKDPKITKEQTDEINKIMKKRDADNEYNRIASRW